MLPSWAMGVNSHEMHARRIGALALCLLLTLAPACSAPDTADEPATGSAPAESADDPVDALATFADGIPEAGAVDAAVLAEGLRRLAGAASGQGVISQDVAVDLRATAEHVQLNPESIDVANTVRQTLDEVTDALDDRLADAEARRLREATEAIGAGEPLTGQAAALREYFRLTAAALAAARG